MNLVERRKTRCVLMEEARTADGRGGEEVTWSDGETFEAAITHKSSRQEEPAEAADAREKVRVTTGRDVSLPYHAVFRRVTDGRVYRVTSNEPERETPAGAGLDMRRYDAEAYELPGGEDENGQV